MNVRTSLSINSCQMTQLLYIISQLKLCVVFSVSSIFTISYFLFAARELAVLQVQFVNSCSVVVYYVLY